MESDTQKIENLIIYKKEDDLIQLLRSGLDPNFEGGWPIRLAARYGHSTIVETMLEYGANPHLLSESGASTLQLAVFSGKHWDTDEWTSLLSCCDSSQLADGAAVAIIFNNEAALNKILATGRCNTNIPTTLTGKTVDLLAKGYKITPLINVPTMQNYNGHIATISPRISRQDQTVLILDTLYNTLLTLAELSTSAFLATYKKNITLKIRAEGSEGAERIEFMNYLYEILCNIAHLFTSHRTIHGKNSEDVLNLFGAEVCVFYRHHKCYQQLSRLPNDVQTE